MVKGQGHHVKKQDELGNNLTCSLQTLYNGHRSYIGNFKKSLVKGQGYLLTDLFANTNISAIRIYNVALC